MKLKLYLKNCYGIGQLQTELNFLEGRKANIIYAPNGTMKTSLSKTFKDISEGKQPEDLHYPERATDYEIKVDESPIQKDFIYVFDNEDCDGAQYISSFLARRDLKDKYDAIHKELDDAKSDFNKAIKNLAQSTDCEKEILESFRENDNENYFDCLIRIKTIIDSTKTPFCQYTFRFNDVFDSKGKVKEFIDTFHNDIVDFFKRYEELMSTSSLFTTGANAFGTTQANSLLKSVEDGRYFGASHTLVLSDGLCISTKEQFEDLIKTAKEKLMSDSKIKKKFEKIDQKLAGNADMRNFKDVIESDPAIIAKIVDYEKFRKEVILGYVQNCGVGISSLIALYHAKSVELRQIIQDANAESGKWTDIIQLYNERFFVPFEVKIGNKVDMLLREKTASLLFIYQDGHDHPVSEKSDKLVSALSRGEQKAFYILQNLFAIEARKAEGKPTLVVFDDVADSFDYKNKYAIVEYLSDIMSTSGFYLLILTHNFDFYRTVVSRLNIKDIYFAEKDNNRNIKLFTGIYKTDLLKNRLIDKAKKDNVRAFIGMIPFVRNIIEYTEGITSKGYLLLTSCLHIKENTRTIKYSEIADVMSIINGFEKNMIDFSDKLYLEVLYKEADAIFDDTNEIDLANKLVLSVAIRLKAEEYMFTILTNEEREAMKANHNQTSELYKQMQAHHLSTHKEQCLLMNKVLMLTSENIHLNNFMFEPLVDLSIVHLKKLYKEVKALSEGSRT